MSRRDRRDRRRRLLCLAPTFLPVQGGAERLLAELLGRLSLRYEVRLLVPEPPRGTAGQPPARLPFEVERYAERLSLDRCRGRRLHRGFLPPPFGVTAVARAVAVAREWRPDVVSAHYAVPTGLAGLVAARAAGAPCVLSLVGRDVPGPGVPTGWRPWVRLIAARADQVTYISDYCRRAIHGRSRGAPGVVVGAGVTPATPAAPDAVATRRAALRIEAEEPVLFSLQRLVPYKGTDIVVRAMARLQSRSAVLLVAGSGPERERLEALTSSLGLSDRIRWLGFVPDEEVPTYWSMADLFVFHSYYETFGLVLAEAMAAGKAVVSVRSTAIPEVVRGGIDGALVSPGDPVALAEAIQGLLEQSELRRRMGEAGRARALSRYDWDSVARRYAHVFDTLAPPPMRD